MKSNQEPAREYEYKLTICVDRGRFRIEAERLDRRTPVKDPDIRPAKGIVYQDFEYGWCPCRYTVYTHRSKIPEAVEAVQEAYRAELEDLLARVSNLGKGIAKAVDRPRGSLGAVTV